jgi:hypothetical protein
MLIKQLLIKTTCHQERKDEMKIDISINEIETLLEWVKNLDPAPIKVTLIATSTGIGTHIRAEVHTSENEGQFKDITDYDSW